jgi:lipoprotein-anchoring transpeptidase ErfK/SrfK
MQRLSFLLSLLALFSFNNVFLFAIAQETQITPIIPSEPNQTPVTPIIPPPGSSPTNSAPTKPPEFIETRLVLKLKQRRVFVFKGDKQVASYPVAVGKKGWETPTGNFKIIQMVKNPTWQNPWNGKVIPAGPKNPIGERWIGFWTDGKNQIGFHGTPTINSIGQAASHGCVRMLNSDVKAMFEFVKVGTPVLVQLQ